jgi:hypothetical protein
MNPTFLTLFKQKVSLFLCVAMVMLTLPTIISYADTGSIDANDHFTLSTTGSTMDAGDTLVFTVKAYDDADQNTGQNFTSSNYAYIHIMDPSTWEHHQSADITAVNNMTVVGHGSVTYGNEALTANSTITGSNDNLIKVNIADGDGATNTFTVTSTSTFGIFVEAPGITINDDQGAPLGQDFQQITVTAASSGANNLVAEATVTTAELNEEITVNLDQLNSGGGLVTAALTDVGVTVAMNGTGEALITKVNGVDISAAASIAAQSLINGELAITVVASSLGDGNGTLTITPSSVSLAGEAVVDTVAVSAVTTAEINGYGPMNGDTGVPTSAPVDFMFNKDPSSSITFPLTNTSATTFSLVEGSVPGSGTEATGGWNYFSENWGGSTVYRVMFQPNGPLTENTQYTAAIKKTFAGSTNLPEFLTALSSNDNYYYFSFTTGSGGGSFDGTGDAGVGGFVGGFTGEMGGMMPPIAMLGYPMPGSWDVPTNISCVVVDFDRPMSTSTLTTSNIYLKKLVSGTESSVSGTPAITVVGDDDDAICISGYTLAANSEYRVVVTRDVTDTAGNQLAGMPVDDDGNPTMGFGWGFENMGPFKESFHTGTGSSDVTASLMGMNLGQYGSTITSVPVGTIVRVSFDNALSASTINSTNVTLKKNGTVPIQGEIRYDSMSNAIEFMPSSALSASTSYTFGISTGVQSVSGTALSSAISQSFTTGAADSTNPQLVFAEADNYGIFMQFNEPLLESTATDRSYYTLKTCDGTFSNATTCSGTITTQSLTSGITAHYEKMDNSVWMDGLTLTPGQDFWVEVATGVTDMSGNGIHASNNKSWTGPIMDAQNFAGGQGMFNMDSMGFEDFDMGTMGERPIGAWPMNTMAGSTTKYFLDIPISTQIPADGYIELTFPTGYAVTGVKQDDFSPMNDDFNGPATGTVTFDNNITSISGATDGGGAQANDGVGYIAAARKVYLQLDTATLANDFLMIDLDGITNPNEAKDFDSSGYQVQIKTYNSSGTLLEAMTSMPIFISSAGNHSISGTVAAGATKLNGVKVYLGSPMTGPMEATTANDAAGGGEDGEYTFTNLPEGDYHVWTEPTFTVGATDYQGQEWPEPLYVDGAETQNISVTSLAAGASTAPVPISIAWTGSLPTNLGFGDSIDIFAGGQNGFVKKTVSRATLGTSPYTTTMYLPSTGQWFMGIGPAMPNGPMGKMPETNWMPAGNSDLEVIADNLGATPSTALGTVSFTITASDKTITGKVLDGSGTAISNAEVYAYNPNLGLDAHTQAASDGSFTLDVVEGGYTVGAFLPGMPSSQEVAVDVQTSAFYVGGSPTASTGSSGDNPFNLNIAKPGSTIQGRVSDGTNAIDGSAVWAHRTDAPGPPVHAMTNSSGNFTLYVTDGTWQVEADAPGYGYIGSKTITVSTNSEEISGQNFTVTTTDLGTITGSVGSQSGAMVWAFGANGGNEAKTNSSGAYSIKVPAGTYTVEAFVPGIGELAPLTSVAVTAGNTNSGNNFTLGTTRTITISIKDSEAADATLSEDAFIDFFGTNGKGNGTPIATGNSSATLQLVEGTYYMGAWLPGVPFENLTITGADYDSETEQITVNGAETINIAIPDLYTITGQITNASAAGVNDAWVSVHNAATKKHFGTITSNNAASGGEDGEFTLKVPAGTYSIGAEKPGYSSTPVDLTVTANSSGNNFTLTTNNRTITGTVSDGSGNPIANAFIWAEGNGGGFAGTESGTDGTYELSVKSSIWTVNAGGMGYIEGTAVSVDTSSASQTGKNFSLTALTGGDALNPPKTESITPSSGGTINDSGTNTKIVVPPNALGSGSDAGQITTNENNQVPTTPSANPLGNGQDITATDSDGNPQTNLDDEIEFTLQLTAAELSAEGITTDAGVNEINNAYWDESTTAWVSLPTNTIYYDASDNVVAGATVAAADDLSSASVSYIELTSTTDHLTTFAPVVSTGATPPATPTGLAATAGDGQAILSWTANSEDDMSSYNIWEANVTEGVASTLTHAECSGGSCTKTMTGLTNATTYSYQLIAVDTDTNQSAGSTAVEVTPVATVVSGGGVILTSGSRSSRNSSNDDEEDDDEDEDEDEDDEDSDDDEDDSDDADEDSDDEDEDSDDEEESVDDDDEAEAAVVEAPAPTPTPALDPNRIRPYGETPFFDISKHWARSYIQQLYVKGVVQGKKVITFAPEDSVTRAELLTMLERAFDYEAEEAGDGDEGITRSDVIELVMDAAEMDLSGDYPRAFDDVPPFKSYYAAVNYAAAHGVIKGYSDGLFRPGRTINRAEASKIITLMMNTRIINLVWGIFDEVSG